MASSRSLRWCSRVLLLLSLSAAPQWIRRCNRLTGSISLSIGLDQVLGLWSIPLTLYPPRRTKLCTLSFFRATKDFISPSCVPSVSVRPQPRTSSRVSSVLYVEPFNAMAKRAGEILSLAGEYASSFRTSVMSRKCLRW